MEDTYWKSDDNIENLMHINFQYLHLYLLKIDLHIREAIRRWELAGLNFSENFRGLFISEGTIQKVLEQPIGGNWGSISSLPEEEIQQFTHLRKQVAEEIDRIKTQASVENKKLKLEEFRNLFNLSEFEFNAFLVCLSPMLDTRYEKIFGFLHDDVTTKYASISLIFDLLLKPDFEKLTYLKYFNKSSTLIKNHLIRNYSDIQSAEKPILKQNYIVPGEVISWLIGEFQPDKYLAEGLTLIAPTMNNRTSEIFDLPEGLDFVLKQKPIIILYGHDVLQKQYISDHIAAKQEQSLLVLELDKLQINDQSKNDLFRIFMRDVKLSGAIPMITGLDAVFNTNEEIDTFFQQFLNFEDTVLVHQEKNWPILRNQKENNKPVFWLNCVNPPGGKRLNIWKEYLGDNSRIDDQELEIFANQFNLSASQIQNVAFSAQDLAISKGMPTTIDDLYEAARFYSSHHLNTLATKIQPRYKWEDIVLPEDGIQSLRELANTIRWRSVVLDEWGVGKRLMPYAGVSALFAGPPGTGKTLAAQVIAAELRMDLYKIDLSTVVSKYIGETEKNLERIFSQAKNSNAILFFDEADSIFGKRSEVKDAHDRYANIEVGYLLQRMETYDGVVILATNLRSNMDEAFTRRIQFIVDFPFPDEKERQKIWKVLFPAEVPLAEDIDLNELGDRFKLTGGSIRNVIISASFLAASENSYVSNQHLLHAIRREMQKMGRLVQDKDLLLTQKEGGNGKNSK